MGFLVHVLSAYRITFVPLQKSVGLRSGLILTVCACVFLLVGASGCAFPFGGAAVDGYASADVETWRDADGDGQRDPDEAPFPWVTIQMSYERSITDSEGRGAVGVFKPGCARECWKDEAVSVMVPPGYRATTPTEVGLTGAKDDYAFGFQPEESTQSLTLPDEPGWVWAFVNRGLDVVDLDFDADKNRLTVAFDSGGSMDEDTLYGEIFDVIDTLKEIESVSVEQVEIASLPSGPVVVCEMSQVDGWVGKIPPAEIVSTYCRREEN
jgi:hypothetical protein